MKTIKRKLQKNGCFYYTLRNSNAAARWAVCSDAVETLIGTCPERVIATVTSVRPLGKWIEARRFSQSYITVYGAFADGPKLVLDPVRESLNRIGVQIGGTFWFKFQIDKS